MFYICTNLERLTGLRLMVKKILLGIILFFAFSVETYAQRHELGIRLGSSNLVGDIGRTNWILQKPTTRNIADYGLPIYMGVLYRMNFNPYQTLRFDLGYSHVQFDDNDAKEQYRKNRGLWGTNSAYEADVLFEYNFYPVNNEQKDGMLSPYIFGGLGFMVTNIKQLEVKVRSSEDEVDGMYYYEHLDSNESDPTYYYVGMDTYTSNRLIMSIPFGAGLKYKFNYNWVISGEVMFRPTFSDGIDYSMIENRNVKYSYTNINNTKSYNTEPYKSQAKEDASAYLKENNVGNKNSKDWINSVTLSLTYSFGRPPCYCE